MEGAFVSGRQLQKEGERTFLEVVTSSQKVFSAHKTPQNYLTQVSFDRCQSPGSIGFWLDNGTAMIICFPDQGKQNITHEFYLM